MRSSRDFLLHQFPKARVKRLPLSSVIWTRTSHVLFSLFLIVIIFRTVHAQNERTSDDSTRDTEIVSDMRLVLVSSGHFSLEFGAFGRRHHLHVRRVVRGEEVRMWTMDGMGGNLTLYTEEVGNSYVDGDGEAALVVQVGPRRCVVTATKQRARAHTSRLT